MLHDTLFGNVECGGRLLPGGEQVPSSLSAVEVLEYNGSTLVLHQSLGDIAGVAFNVVLDGDDLSEERFLD